MNKGTCKYYTGLRSPICAAGVNYDSVTTEPGTPGSGLRIPCHAKPIFDSPHQLAEHARRGKCPMYEEPTDEEIAAEGADWKKHLEKVKIVDAFIRPIRQEQKGKNWRGVKECPVCKNKLHIEHRGCNGHMTVQCETKDCVNWIE